MYDDLNRNNLTDFCGQVVVVTSWHAVSLHNAANEFIQWCITYCISHKNDCIKESGNCPLYLIKYLCSSLIMTQWPI